MERVVSRFPTPQFLIDSLNTEISPGLTYGQSLGLSSDPNTAIDINDYISTGNNRDPYENAFQPRLGFSLRPRRRPAACDLRRRGPRL